MCPPLIVAVKPRVHAVPSPVIDAEILEGLLKPAAFAASSAKCRLPAEIGEGLDLGEESETLDNIC